GSVLIWWRRCCGTAVRRGRGAPTLSRLGHYLEAGAVARHGEEGYSPLRKGVAPMRVTLYDVRLAIVTRWLAKGFCWLAFAGAVSAQTIQPRLEILPPVNNEWVRLSSSSDLNRVITLQASSNLLDWQWIGTLHDGLVNYPDAASTHFPKRFYRLWS